MTLTERLTESESFIQREAGREANGAGSREGEERVRRNVKKGNGEERFYKRDCVKPPTHQADGR